MLRRNVSHLCASGKTQALLSGDTRGGGTEEALQTGADLIALVEIENRRFDRRQSERAE